VFTAGPAAPPHVLCAVGDRRLAELSGMVVDGDAVWAMADGGRRVVLFRIDPDDCTVRGSRTADVDPFDAEDLARGPDGELWVGDLGDNRRDRETVAVVVLPRRGEARLHRLTYPDGPHDAEALLVDGTGVPYVVTKEAGRPAGVYRTEGPPSGTGPTPLVRVGEVALPPSDTVGGPLGGLGSRLVTGAATSADGRVVALRSYTDAWLYAVPDGDIAAALAGTPTRVPLPDEPQGEAIAFTRDGTLLSGSETRDGRPGELRAVPGAAALVAAPLAEATTPSAAPAGVQRPTAPDAAWLPAALGAAAVVVLLGLLTLVVGARRR
jgi:hypothetical protein